MKKTYAKRTTRVIVDERDATKDRWINERLAEEWFCRGRLEVMEQGGTWVYCLPKGGQPSLRY